MPPQDPKRPSPVPAHVRRFIAEHIRSVAELELLLLLRLSPERGWIPADLGRELRVEPAWAESQVRRLTGRGLVEASDQPETTYRFRPRSPELAEAVATLAQAFLLHRVSVIELIYTGPSEGAQALADAFRLTREPPHG